MTVFEYAILRTAAQYGARIDDGTLPDGEREYAVTAIELADQVMKRLVREEAEEKWRK